MRTKIVTLNELIIQPAIPNFIKTWSIVSYMRLEDRKTEHHERFNKLIQTWCVSLYIQIHADTHDIHMVVILPDAIIFTRCSTAFIIERFRKLKSHALISYVEVLLAVLCCTEDSTFYPTENVLHVRPLPWPDIISPTESRMRNQWLSYILDCESFTHSLTKGCYPCIR
jgi:hypothetical protein